MAVRSADIEVISLGHLVNCLFILDGLQWICFRGCYYHYSKSCFKYEPCASWACQLLVSIRGFPETEHYLKFSPRTLHLLWFTRRQHVAWDPHGSWRVDVSCCCCHGLPSQWHQVRVGSNPFPVSCSLLVLCTDKKLRLNPTTLLVIFLSISNLIYTTIVLPLNCLALLKPM